MMPLGAPSISKYGSLVRPDAQIVALRAHCTRTALKAPPKNGGLKQPDYRAPDELCSVSQFVKKCCFVRGGGCYTFSDSPRRWLFGDVWVGGGGGGLDPYFFEIVKIPFPVQSDFT